MCLDKLSYFKPKGIGYKVFYSAENPNMLASPIHYNEYLYTIGVPVTDTNTTPIKSDKGEFYRPGFHILENKGDAKEFQHWLGGQIYKVKYEDVVATGIDLIGKCVVARTMTILKKAPTILERIKNVFK